MENQYDVGIANRYALFLEEGENSLTAIKKKLSKEIRQKNKAIKKENAEAKKLEASKAPPEVKPVIIDVPVPKKDEKEEKPDVPKPKEKKPNDPPPVRKEKDVQEKPRTVKNDSTVDVAVIDDVAEPVEKDSSKLNENGPPRKTYERKPRERRYESSDQNQSRPYPNQYNKRSNYNKDEWNSSEWSDKEAVTGDNAATPRYHNTENRGAKENGYGSYNSEYRPRGGGRFRGGGNRGGRGNYNGSDRRREYNDQRNEQKDESDVFKNPNDSWGDEKAENSNDVTTDNQKDEETNKAVEDETSPTDEQKEVKEYLTLDEWKKLQGERQKPQYNLRKAGEGEDLTQWKNMRELEKKKDEEFLETNHKPNEKSNHHEHEKENTGNENVQRVGRQKHIDINVHFRESSIRGRGGRIIRNNRFGGGGGPRGGGSGGGGGPRGGGSGGGYQGRNEDRNNEGYSGETRSYQRKPREGYNSGGSSRGGSHAAVRQNAPKMDDENAFPSLG